MSRSTISTFQLFELIPDAESARAYDEAAKRLHGEFASPNFREG